MRRSRVHNTSEGRTPVPDEPSLLWPFLLAGGLAAGAGGILLARWWGRSERKLARALLGAYNSLLGLLVGLPALLLFLMWTITEHTVTYRNENILLAGPLTFMALPLGIALIAGSRRAAEWLWSLWLVMAAGSLLALLLKALPWFDQDNWMLIALVLPLNLGLALAFRFVPGLRPAVFSRYFVFKAKEPSQVSEGGSAAKSRQRSRSSSAGR
ncbi:MAG: hypothetical protein ACOCVR_01805 [Myxococcota bacterium]